MARTDEHTKRFMAEVAGSPEPDASKVLDPLRTARLATKIVTKPKEALGKLLVAKATKAMTSEDNSKLAGLSIVAIFGHLNDHYKTDWWDWEPETVWTTLKKDGVIESIQDDLRNAISALQVVVKSNAPFEDWHIFEKVAHAFNFTPVNFSVLQPLELDQAALAMAILMKLRPKQEFESEVLGYVAVCAHESGVVYLPNEMFPGVQPFLDKIDFDTHLRDSVKNLWDKKQTTPTTTDAEIIQLERLKEVSDYLKSGGF